MHTLLERSLELIGKEGLFRSSPDPMIGTVLSPHDNNECVPSDCRRAQFAAELEGWVNARKKEDVQDKNASCSYDEDKSFSFPFSDLIQKCVEPRQCASLW